MRGVLARETPPVIAVLVPVLGRPQNAAPLARSLAASTVTPHVLLWLVSPGDTEQHAACKQAGGLMMVMEWEPGPGDFAKKINQGYRVVEEPFLFQAADDVTFLPGWDVEALRVIEQTETGVCGTNDLANPVVRAGKHATHSLIRRAYIDECGGSLDGPGTVFHEGYSHQYVDNELIGVAKARDCFSFAHESHVLHRHPTWNSAQMDDTYERGRVGFNHDRKLFAERQKRWRAIVAL